MSVRIEVTEEQWLGGLTSADYLVLDLGADRKRPWLEEARERVELVGRGTAPADEAFLARALELDVDFLALATAAPGFDARRLPIRLIVEQGIADATANPDLFGAAWARRIIDWEPGDMSALAEFSRRERVFLSAPEKLPDENWMTQVAPFAIAAPVGADPAEIARIRGS